MSLPSPWFFYVATGLAGGLLGGTFGVGGGVIMVPVLVALAHPQKEAQGIALAAMVPMALLGAIRYYRHPEIPMNLTVAALVAVGALVGVYFGTSIAAGMQQAALRKAFAVLLMLVAVRLWWR